MRAVVAVAALALIVSGCASGATESTPTAGSGSSGPSSAASPQPSTTAMPPLGSAAPTASASASALAAPYDWKVVSSGLERPGAQVVFDADQSGQAVVASVLSEVSAEDYDAGVVYSTNAGDAWQWGGVVQMPGRQFPAAVAVTPDGAIVVGTSQTGAEGSDVSEAFIALAAAPDYALTPMDLPKAFAGDNVHLQDVAVVGDEWVIVGYEIDGKDAGGQGRPTGLVWRSADKGETWTRQAVKIDGLKSLALKGFAVAPDGSWNVVGEGSNDDKITQYDAVWLQSTDKGATFTRVSPKAFTGDFDQAADSIVFSADGSAAILGWDEVTDEHGSNVSALWVSAVGHGVKRLGSPRVPVTPETPLGEFLEGLVWQGETLVGWGSLKEDYPMDDVQFWALQNAALQPTDILAGGGTPLAVAKILPGEGTALALGFTGELDNADITVWRGAWDAK